MNAGANISQADTLLFLHADSMVAGRRSGVCARWVGIDKKGLGAF